MEKFIFTIYYSMSFGASWASTYTINLVRAPRYQGDRSQLSISEIAIRRRNDDTPSAVGQIGTIGPCRIRPSDQINLSTLGNSMDLQGTVVSPYIINQSVYFDEIRNLTLRCLKKLKSQHQKSVENQFDHTTSLNYLRWP